VPDLTLVAFLEVELPHLEHPLLERVEEVCLVHGEHVDDALGLRRLEQRLVGAQEPSPHLQLPVVDGVEPGAGPVERRGAVVPVGGAGGAERRPQRGVQRVRLGEPGLEVAAVRDPQRVAAGERHQVLHREPVRAEELDERRRVEEGRRERREGVRVHRPRPVAAAQRHAVVGAPSEEHGVARRQSQDVGAGDDARALRLQHLLDAVDHLEAAQALVRLRVFLRRVAVRRVDQHRRVAALHEAVVEVQPQEAAGEGGVLGESVVDDAADHHLRERAAHAVVVHAERRHAAAGGHLQEDEELHKVLGRNHLRHHRSAPRLSEKRGRRGRRRENNECELALAVWRVRAPGAAIYNAPTRPMQSVHTSGVQSGIVLL